MDSCLKISSNERIEILPTILEHQQLSTYTVREIIETALHVLDKCCFYLKIDSHRIGVLDQALVSAG